MSLFKSPFSDASSVSLHGVELDIVNGFVEVLDDVLTPQIEATLTKHLGFTLANEADVESTLAVQDAGDQQKRDNDERAGLLAKIKAWGLKIDGRKNLAWVRERFDEFVQQGLIQPGAEPQALPEPEGPSEPATPEVPADPNETGTPQAIAETEEPEAPAEA